MALKAAFSGITVYLCDFNREQCWERWVKAKQNSSGGLTKDESDDLLGLLRGCASASPCTEEGFPVDKYYQEAVTQLKASEVWKKHESVRFWLESKWLNIPKES